MMAENKKIGIGQRILSWLKSFPRRFLAWLKERCRKFIVALKRRPQHIPLAVFIVAFIIYSFNLTAVSNTTALLGGPNMGLAAFAIMLFSMLSLLCFNNAFPYRKPVHKPMLIIMFVMQAIILFSDWYYLQRIVADGAAVDWNQNTFIYFAQYYLTVHIAVIAVGVVLTALLPVYSKLLRKINTNVEVEGNADMGDIDLAGDE